MGKKLYGNPKEKGRLLASGRGGYDMMDICYRKGWDDDNTILEVTDTNDLDSRWRIYQRNRLTTDAMEQQRKSQR